MTTDITNSSASPGDGAEPGSGGHADALQQPEIHQATSPDHNPFAETADPGVSAAHSLTPPPASSPQNPTGIDSNDGVPSLPRRPEEELPNNEPVDPQVASLKAMFPDFDNAVLLSVLESVGGDQDRAIDMLLGMSDPDYVSQEPPPAPPSQTDLDEQLARRLMLEEEQQHQANWQAQQPGRQSDTAYQPRVGGGRHTQQPQPQQGRYDSQAASKDTMAEFQDQFSKIAESGKKTFGTIFSKVKAKMQEYDQPRPGQGSASGSTEPRWGGQSGSGQAQPYQPQAQQQSYYDPNPQGYEPQSIRPVQGYDTGANQVPNPNVQGQRQPTTGYTTPPGANTSSIPISTEAPTYARSTSPPLAEVPRPPSTGAGAGTGAPNIDYGRLGLLPKRPVSLLRDQPQPQTKPSDDDDELEYAENPFEEGHK